MAISDEDGKVKEANGVESDELGNKAETLLGKK